MNHLLMDSYDMELLRAKGRSREHVDPEEYLRLAESYERTGYLARQVVDRLDSLRVDKLTDQSIAEGSAADALYESARGLFQLLRDVPPLAQSTSLVLSRHGLELRRLQQEASQARARAQAKLRVVEGLDDDRERTARYIDDLASDYEQDLLVADVSAAEDSLHRLRSAQLELDSIEADRNRAKNELKEIEDYIREQSRSEEDLDDETVEKLREQGLGALKDPSSGLFSWIADLVTSIGGAIVDLVNAVGGLVSAIVSGDFGAFLWSLRDALDALASLASLVGTVVSVALFLAGQAHLAVGVMKISSDISNVLKAAALGVELLIAVGNVPHPKTGEGLDLTKTLTKAVVVVAKEVAGDKVSGTKVKEEVGR